MTTRAALSGAAAALLGCLAGVRADDWPMFGRDAPGNAVSPEAGSPTDWHAKGWPKTEIGDKVTERYTEDRNIRWKAELGSLSIGSPVVAGGLVWVSTNNDHPRDPARKGDAGVLMGFRERDGQFLYQYVAPRLTTTLFHDWPHGSIGCTPLAEGDRLWFTTNRCETVCLDVGPLRRGDGVPRVVWKVDMVKELGVHPKTAPMALTPTNSIPASYRGRIYVNTWNGRDETHLRVPAPQAPSLVCFDRDTGKVLWSDNSPGENILDGQWAGPLVIEVNGRGQVIHPQGDGWVRSFDALTGKLIWKFDTNPKDAKWGLGGRATKNYVLSAPLYHDGRLYVVNGQQPEHYEGPAWLYCLDPTKEGDISRQLDDGPGKGKPNPNSGVVWRFGGAVPKELAEKDPRNTLLDRTIGSVVVHDGLLYVASLTGYLHCLDARTGREYWWHDMRSAVYGSPLWADGKVYIGTEDGDVWIFRHGKAKQEPRRIDAEEPIRSSLVFANGVLYVMTERTLYAIRERK
jgi:outer membrane protein assembly factor BamB